jgi:holo-ACP synthase CitX
MPLKEDPRLEAKERRSKEIQALYDSYPTIVTVEALQPGTDKHTPAARYLVGRYGVLVSSFSTWIGSLHEAELGPNYVFGIQGEATPAKERAMRLEATPLGRLIDIDVYDKAIAGPLTRGTLRKCLLCDRPAAVCRKEETHTAAQLQEKIAATIRSEDLVLIQQILNKAVDAELDLDPKFGLVTPKTAGSHTDMTIELMRKSKHAVVPYLAELFFLPLWEDSMPRLFQSARSIGLVAEQAMYRATGGVNTHKGMIFNLGLAVLAVGTLVCRRLPWSRFYEIVETFAQPLQDEIGVDASTFGQKIARQYPAMGARAEAIHGFPNVARIMEAYTDDSWKTKMGVFVELVKHTEDTVLFKRAGSMDRYREVKGWFETLNAADPQAVAALSQTCVKEKLSFGGAADLFVVATFLRLIQVHFLQPTDPQGERP